MKLRAFMGLLDPKTKKATAFYAFVGLLSSDTWHRGLNKWNLVGWIIATGLGSLAGIAQLLHGEKDGNGAP